jgi:hypothetical protein
MAKNNFIIPTGAIIGFNSPIDVSNLISFNKSEYIDLNDSRLNAYAISFLFVSGVSVEWRYNTVALRDDDYDRVVVYDLADIDIASLPLNLDAFYRLRVSNPETIFDSKQLYDKQPLIWDEVLTGGATSNYNTNQASTTLRVRGNVAESATRQTFRWFNYQPGKSTLVNLTGVLGFPEAAYTSRVGQFNDDNGFYFDMRSDGPGVVIRSKTTGSVVDNRVSQANWNIDKMDGSGKSGITLDFTKTQIFFFDYEWLGVGSVKFGFFVNGIPYYVHQFNHANFLDVVYTSTPNLPLRYEISSDGTGAGAKDLVHICSTVIVEGGRNSTGILRGLNRADNTLTTNNNADIYPLIGIRLKSTNLGAFVNPIDFTILCNSTSEYAWYLIVEPTEVGAALTWNTLAGSSVEYCYPTNATTVTGGIIIGTGLASDTTQVKAGVEKVVGNELNIGSFINGTPQRLFICVQRITGTTETFFSSLTFSETV